MTASRIIFFIIIPVFIGIGFFHYSSYMGTGPFANFPFKLGLDLNGGTRLLYEIETENLSTADTDDSLSVLKEVIERRVNLFGVSEPVVQIESSFNSNRLIVELPGVTDINEAVRLIGETPLLEFRLLSENIPQDQEVLENTPIDEMFIRTGLTGRFLSRAQVVFDSSIGVSNQPSILIEFNEEGRALFAEITRNNIGRTLTIFLDGQPISNPIIQEEISQGTAQISGNFTPEEARELTRNLNYGALPLPISLLSTEKVGPTLGRTTLSLGVQAGIVGFLLIIAFLTFWYRLPGLLASIALLFYIAVVLALFKLIPVTITSAGIAGLILSFGIAVDSNVLIFARVREEIKKGRSISEAIEEGFARAWTSIRDSNISNILTAVILFWFGTSIVKGFALTLALGVAVSMMTAIWITKTFLRAIRPRTDTPLSRFLFDSGFFK